jgi:hypothetical protein
MLTTKTFRTWPDGEPDVEYIVLLDGVPLRVISQTDCHGELPPAVFSQEEIRRQFSGLSVEIGQWKPKRETDALGPYVVVQADVRILEQ